MVLVDGITMPLTASRQRGYTALDEVRSASTCRKSSTRTSRTRRRSSCRRSSRSTTPTWSCSPTAASSPDRRRARCARRSTRFRSTRYAGRRTTAPARTCSSTSSVSWSSACGEDVAGRLHTARSRNDIDMTMYRMRQREFIVRLIDASVDLRAALIDLAARHRETLFAAHTHTQPAQPTTLAHYLLGVIEQLERDVAAAAGGPRVDQPLSARLVRHYRHRVSDRSTADERSARLRRTDRQHLRQHRDGRLPARERVGGGRADRRPRPVRPGPAALVHGGVRLPAAGGRLRAVEQHHAAEAQPGGARARPRDCQQGARPGVGHHAQRPQHAVWRHRRHRGRSAAARGRRCSGTRRGR